MTTSLFNGCARAHRGHCAVLLAAATAMTAAGFLTLPPTAHAEPACTQWGVIGDFGLKQSNGFVVSWDASPGPQQSFNGDQATTTSTSGGAILDRGIMFGGVQGGHVDFTIHWDSGLRGHYAGDVEPGDVGSQRFAHGRTNDEANPGSTANWDSTTPFECLTPEPAPPAQPAPPPADVQRVATVTNDVDVYNIAHDENPDANGVQGAKIGTLRAGQQVRLEGPCLPTGWCHIRTSELNGFVLGNLQF